MRPLICLYFILRKGKRRLITPGLLFMFALSACSILRMPEAEPARITTGSGLTYVILHQGDGRKPVKGDKVSVHYTGMLSDSTLFDSSLERGEPAEFRLGNGQVIPGLEEGVALMNEGTKARFVIPPDLAYGEKGFGPVPGNETLYFEVQLLKVAKTAMEHDTGDLQVQEVHGGLKYALLDKGKGKPLSEGMYVSLNYTGYIDDKEPRVFDSSYERDTPLSFVIGRGTVIPGWEAVLPLLRVGDIAKVWIPWEMAYGESGRGPIPPRTNLVFNLEVLDADIPEAPEKFSVDGLDTLKTESGLRYIIIREGTGDLPVLGNVLEIHYSGYLSDGTLFDSSVERGEPLRFVQGRGQVIEGLDEAFYLLPGGTKARLIIPPQLAFGEEGNGPVPPGETLIFDVELLDIKR